MRLEDALAYERLIKPIPDPRLRAWLGELDLERLVVRDREFTARERQARLETFRERVRAFLRPYFPGLERFEFIYVLNGNTDYVHHVLSTSPGVGTRPDDYRYYRVAQRVMGGTPGEEELLFSYPSWQSGTDENLRAAEALGPRRWHVDVAYLGLTRDWRPLDAASCESLSVSFSKTLAIPYNRVAALFSRRRQPHLELMHAAGHVNLSGVELVNHLLPRVDPDFWTGRYTAPYLEVCARRGLRPTGCLLFGHEAQGRRVSVAEHLASQTGPF